MSDYLLAQVPIYGTRDAGRGLWRKIRRILISHGFRENFIMNALYSFEVDGEVKCLMATHVDDVLWACDPEYQHIIDKVQEELIFGSKDERKFRFCGMEVEQHDDFSITCTCEKTSVKLDPIRLSKSRSKQVDAACTDEEREQLMSVVGSLMWICRTCSQGRNIFEATARY